MIRIEGVSFSYPANSAAAGGVAGGATEGVAQDGAATAGSVTAGKTHNEAASGATANGSAAGSLRDVDLAVNDGEFVVLCGPSGCGKTTLTRLVNGLIPHYYTGELVGTVMLDGASTRDLTLFELSEKVGSVFQNPRSQFFNVDVTSELAFGCENHGWPEDDVRSRVGRIARDLGMEGLLGRSIFDLSGGEKQKVACASAAAVDPGILVLDEPSSNLDAAAIDDLHDFLAAAKDAGETVLVAEHRLHYLHDLADRFVCLDAGRIAGDWTRAEFDAIPAAHREALGLRPVDLGELKRCASREGEATCGEARRRQGQPESTSGSAMREGTVGSESEQHARHRGAAGHPASNAPSSPSEQATRLRPAGGSAHGMPRNHTAACAPWVFSDVRYRRSRREDLVVDVDRLEFPSGTVTAIVGRNGAGKTTLLRCMCGLVRGARVTATDPQGVAHRGRHLVDACYMVMQDVNHQLFCETVLDEVLLSMAEPDEARAHDLLGRMDLGAFAGSHPMALSGGQRQRVALAAAVASARPLLLLDEPTSGLDLLHMRAVADLLGDLASSGTTVAVVTHDPEFVLRCCDRAVRLERGRVVQEYDVAGDEGRSQLLQLFEPRWKGGRP